MREPDHPRNFCFINAQMFSPFYPYSPPPGGGGGGGGEFSLVLKMFKIRLEFLFYVTQVRKRSYFIARGGGGGKGGSQRLCYQKIYPIPP